MVQQPTVGPCSLRTCKIRRFIVISYAHIFCSVSEEENVTEGHTISPDGYNKGRSVDVSILSLTHHSWSNRDALVAAATGSTSFGGVSYSTTATQLLNEMPSGSTGVNHGGVYTLDLTEPFAYS